MLTEHDIDVVAIQETHVQSEEQLYRRGRIQGYKLMGATHHHAHVITTYFKSSIENA